MEKTLLLKKVILWICFVLLIIFNGLLFNMSYVQKQKLIEANKENLQIVASEKAAQVSMFLEFQQERLANLGLMTVFKEAVLYPTDPSKVAAAKATINELKSAIPRIALFTNEGLLFVSETGPVDINYSSHPYFVLNDNKTMFTRYYDAYQKKDYYAIIGPIYDETEKDRVIGAIAFGIDLDKISNIMKETVESETNEVYLIDETGILLSQSEFIGQGNNQGVLIQEVKSEGAKECLADLKEYGRVDSVEAHAENIPQYLSYMGHEVFGAHAYVPIINGCVIAEKGAEEILDTGTMIDYILNIFNKQ